MIVVAIIGVLAAVAIPAFINYFKRSKTSEVPSNLKALFTGADTYYQAEHWTRGAPAVGAASAASSHCEVAAATTDTAPDDNKHILNWTTESGTKSWAALNFEIADPIYYQYAVVGGDGVCSGHSASNTSVYTFRANGDLDGDSTLSTFELATGSNAENELYHAPGLYSNDPLE